MVIIHENKLTLWNEQNIDKKNAYIFSDTGKKIR